jgi:hypothetical protein
VTGVLLGCTKQESSVPKGKDLDFKQVASQFAKALADRDYPAAYAMTSGEYRNRTSLDELRSRFEAIVPLDWGTVGPIEVGETL